MSVQTLDSDESRSHSRRRGSEMTDKQVEESARRGRKITCRFLTGTSHEVSGYVVGLDDYHWMIGTVVPASLREDGAEPISLMLVHKSRVDVTVLHSGSTLGTEDDAAQTALALVGGPFWRGLERNHNNRGR